MKNKKIKNLIFVFVNVITLCVFSFSCFADWVSDGQGYKYTNPYTNEFVVNNWLQTANGYFFLDKNGYVVKGWYLINNKYYYFNNDGVMQTGFITVNNNKYYLDKQTGAMVVGWVQTYENGVVNYYYFDDNGAMVKGWRQINDKWYYFDEGKALVGTWAKINGVWYHLNEAGYMDTGWITDNGKMFHLNVSNGSLTKGWIQDQYGSEYYLSENDGSLTVDTTILVSGIQCTFDTLGRCIAKNQYIGNANGNVGGTGSGNFFESVSQKGTSTSNKYGVNIGVAPGQNNIVGAVTGTSEALVTQSPLEAGMTKAPN